MVALRHAASFAVAAGALPRRAGCKQDNAAPAATGDWALSAASASEDAAGGAGAAASDSAPRRVITLPVAGDEAGDRDLVLSVTTTGQVCSERVGLGHAECDAMPEPTHRRSSGTRPSAESR
ncbi:MAG: hypothetical protein WKG32_15675 [Gemmatimonadaceae bacterium]